MGWGAELTIRKKLTYSFLGLTVCLGLAAVAATGLTLRHAQIQAMHVKASSLARLLSAAVAPGLADDELHLTGATERALDFVKDDGDVSLAGVAVLQNGRQVVEFQKKFNQDPKLEAYSMAVPLAAGQTRYTRVGYQVLATPLAVTGSEPGKRYYLMLVMNTASIDRELRLSALMMVLLGLAMAGVGLLAALALTRAIVKPLDRINRGMRDISEGEGDLTARLDVRGKDEVAQLSANFNHFVANIQGIVNQVIAISSSIASGSLEMSASMHEMDATAQSIAETAENQKTSVQQATAKVGAIGQSSQIIHANVGNALQVFDQAREAAARGGAAVTEVVTGMQAINQNSKQIGNILTVITEIANQTNLLSLNAAIEAAKAGEQRQGLRGGGRGGAQAGGAMLPGGQGDLGAHRHVRQEHPGRQRQGGRRRFRTAEHPGGHRFQRPAHPDHRRAEPGPEPGQRRRGGLHGRALGHRRTERRGHRGDGRHHPGSLPHRGGPGQGGGEPQSPGVPVQGLTLVHWMRTHPVDEGRPCPGRAPGIRGWRRAWRGRQGRRELPAPPARPGPWCRRGCC